MELVWHHMKCGEYTLPLLVLLHCRGEAVHLLLLLQGCMVEGQPSDAPQTAVVGSTGSLVGRTVAPDEGRVG